MNILYNAALKQTNSLRRDLSSLSQNSPTPALQGQISTTLASLSRTLTDYSLFVIREPDAAKKAKATQRLEGFRKDLDSARQEFDRIRNEQKKAEEEVELSQRSELFGNRGVAVERKRRWENSTPENPYAGATSSQSNPLFAGRDFNASQSMSFGSLDPSRESHALRETSFMSQTSVQLDEFLERGRAVLGDLGQQREVLKGTQRKLYSVGTTLGISGETIRMVERRAKQDKWIFGAGVVIFLLFCWGVIYWLR